MDYSSDVKALQQTLTSNTATLRSLRPHDRYRIQGIGAKFTQVVDTAKQGFQLEQGDSLEQNKQKLRNIRDKMKKAMDDQTEEMCQELDNLTPSQQSDVVTFWDGATSFLSGVMNWMGKMFDKIIEAIREGWRWVKEKVTGVFNTVTGWFKNLFSLL